MDNNKTEIDKGLVFLAFAFLFHMISSALIFEVGVSGFLWIVSWTSFLWSTFFIGRTVLGISIVVVPMLITNVVALSMSLNAMRLENDRVAALNKTWEEIFGSKKADKDE